jgi:hypothetical protein
MACSVVFIILISINVCSLAGTDIGGHGDGFCIVCLKWGGGGEVSL